VQHLRRAAGDAVTRPAYGQPRVLRRSPGTVPRGAGHFTRAPPQSRAAAAAETAAAGVLPLTAVQSVRMSALLLRRARGCRAPCKRAWAVRCAPGRGRAWSMSYCSGCHCVGSSLMSSLKRGGRSYTCRKPLGTARCSPASRCAPAPSCSRPPPALAAAAPPAPAPAPSGAAFL